MHAATRERVSRYLTLLVRCEEAVAGFYRACAVSWPDEREFWQGLADEETDHAVRLEFIQARIRQTPHGVGLLHPFSEGSLQNFIAGVERSTELVRSGAVELSEALIHARDIEQSLIGSQPLRGLSFDDPRYENYRKEISAGIRSHAERLLERLKQGAPQVMATS